MGTRFYGLVMAGMLLALSACTSPQTAEEERRVQQWFGETGRIKVLSTVGMIEDLVASIGGDYVDSLALVQGDLDPHTYEMVKGDGEKLAFAQVIFYNGLGLEHGASLRRYLDDSERAVNLGAGLLQRVPDQVIRIDGVIDPHVWMDISLWSLHIEPIVAALSSLDPAHETYFRKRGAELRFQMEKAHADTRRMIQSVPDQRRFLVTSHDAFNYFARAYLAADNEKEWDQWTKRFQAPDGLAPDGQMGATDIRFILEHLKRYNISVLFPESNVSQDAIRKVVEAGAAAGIQLRVCTEALYGDAMGGHGSGADTYLAMIKRNAEVITRNLNYTERSHGAEVQEP